MMRGEGWDDRQKKTFCMSKFISNPRISHSHIHPCCLLFSFAPVFSYAGFHSPSSIHLALATTLITNDGELLQQQADMSFG